MDNSGKFGTSMLVRAIADIILEDVFTQVAFVTEPASVGVEIAVEKILGTYLTENGYAFKFKLVDGALVLERDGRNDVELELEKGNIYHQKFDPDFKQEFTWDEEKGMQVTAYYWAHAPYALTRSDVNWSGYDFSALEGTYFSNEINVTYDVTYTENQQYQFTINGKKRRGEMYGKDKLLVNGRNISVCRKETGDVVVLLLNDDRVRNLRFVRK